MTRLGSRVLLRIALAAALSAASLSAIAVLGSTSAPAPAASPPASARSPLTATPSATPSEVARPSPLPSSTPDPLRAPVDRPTFAPDGRTGDPALDLLIDRLLRAGAAELAGLFPEAAAREVRCDAECLGGRLELTEWTRRLAAGDRSLYAVFTGTEFDVELLIGAGPRFSEAWWFGVEDGRLAEARLFFDAPPAVADAAFYTARLRAPSPASQYERFYVLPPERELPTPPRMHPLSTRTGTSGVDALLAAVASRDPAGIRSRLADPAAPLVRECGWQESRRDGAFAAAWSEDLSAQLYGLHSVSRLPDGYQPRAEHLIVLYRQQSPYWWVTEGLLEREGRIVGLFTSDQGSCSPESMYPPDRYIVPPPEGGLSGLEPSRRSAIGIIDSVIAAIQARDLVTLGQLIDYTKQTCGDDPTAPPGAGPPPCPSAAPAGTSVDILPTVVCHYSFVMRDRAPAAIMEFVAEPAKFALYAVVEGRDERGISGPVWRMVTSSFALTVTERGISRLDSTCGPSYPDALLTGGTPAFVLPPP